MNARVTLISFLAVASAMAQVPRTDPAFPAPGSTFSAPPVTEVAPGPQTLTNFGQTNIFTGGPGPRFTNPALARITNGMTNGLFSFTNAFGMVTNFFLNTNVPGVGGAPFGTNVTGGGFTNVTPAAPGTAPFAPAAPTAPAAPSAPSAPTAPEVPTLPGTTPTVPGVPPANPGTTPTVPNDVDGTPSGVLPPRLNPRTAPPVRIPQQPAPAAPAVR